MSDKASREGNGLLAKFYRHKDEVMAGISVEEAMASRPQVEPGAEIPKEWQDFLAAANATHRSMNALKESETQDLYDKAIADVDHFATALKAWMAKRAA